jgi:hypothetical protein
VLLLVISLLSSGCASLTPLPGHGRTLRYAPRTAAPLASAQRRTGTSGAVEARQRATQARQALLAAVLEVSGSTRRLSGELSRLRARESGLARKVSGIFLRYADHGEQQLRWMEGELAAASQLSLSASEVEDPDMQLALLRLAGPRLEAALLGSLLLAVWIDFLHLADVVLQECPYYSVERLFRQMERWQKRLEPAMRALASREPGQVEAATTDLPALVGHLTGEFAATREEVRVGAENFEKVRMVKELLDMLATASVMKMALLRLPPAAPAMLGVGLVAGSDGVVMGTQVVVSAEWVEMMRRLVQAGVLSTSAVSAAVRIHAGQVMMAEAHDELPRGVRDALGDGPEVRGMHVTGRAGAGMAEPPQHHVLPREHRQWFEQRGFTGDMSIDRFCVEMEVANHQAIHGGGNWRLGRLWGGEWNQLIMGELRLAELAVGRRLTRKEILNIVAGYMKDYDIPMSFSPWRGR